MYVLTTLVFLISIVGLIMSAIKPSLAMFWKKGEEIPTRKQSLKFYGLVAVASFVATGILAPPEDTTNDLTPHKVEVASSEEDAEPEVVYFEITEDDKEILDKNYRDMTEDERERLETIIDNKEDIENTDERDEIEDSLDRLLAEKEVVEEEERIRAEEEAEKERIEKEKREEEERIAAEKAEKEKYETGLTWEDMARDKDGLFGSFIRLKGKIIQVMQAENETQYRLAVDSNYDKVVLIAIPNEKLDSNILEDDIITIEGMSMGNMDYTTVMGAEKTIPSVLVENVYR